jgi:hypothetical protein
MQTNARVARSTPKVEREGPGSLAAAAAVVLLVRLSAALGPLLEAGERLRAGR